MGYIYVFIALIAGLIKGYCGKRTGGYVEQYKDAMFANLIRMALCTIIGLGIIVFQGDITCLRINSTGALIALLSGVATSVFTVSWLISVKRGAYMMVDIFLMLGVVVTIICSFFVLGEPINGKQIVGICVLIIAVLIMCSYNIKLKGKMNFLSVLLLIICGTSSGLADFSQKLYINNVLDYNIAVFNFYTYVFSAVVLGIFYLIFNTKEKGEGNSATLIKDIFGYVFVMALCLFLNSFFKTKAAVYLTSTQLYPLNQGSALILSSIMAQVLFKEKMTITSVIGLILAFVALIIINFL